jgi:RNA-directed DNA polymerase
VVAELNRFLVGWGQYFRSGNATRHFHQLDRYATRRLALLISKKYGHSGWGYGMWVVQANRGLGLHRLVGTVRYDSAHAVG